MYVTRKYTEEKTISEVMIKIVQEYIDREVKQYVTLNENKESI